MTPEPLRVTVWNEFVHERQRGSVRAVYPEGIHTVIAEGLRHELGDLVEVRTATLEEPEHGLSEPILSSTDVLLWWGHMAHDQVDEQIAHRVHERVLDGMGFLALHSAHLAKVFVRLMGTSCMLRWRETGELERLWIVNPAHPIVAGIETEFFELQPTEMYGEFFDIPAPDELITISWFEGGEVFRSGCTFRRGKGRIFYFRPGHETFPVYYHPLIRRILANGVRWAAPTGSSYTSQARHVPQPLSPIPRGKEATET